MERPFNRVLDWLVKDLGKERHDRKPETNRGPRPQGSVLHVFHRSPTVAHHGMDGERGQAHARDALEDAALQHDGPPVLQRRHRPRADRRRRPRRRDQVDAEHLPLPRGQLQLRVPDPLVVPIRLVTLVADVAEDVGPRHAVGAPHQPWVRDGTERLANVGRVGDVAVGREENGAEAGRVGGVADV